MKTSLGQFPIGEGSVDDDAALVEQLLLLMDRREAERARLPDENKGYADRPITRIEIVEIAGAMHGVDPAEVVYPGRHRNTAPANARRCAMYLMRFQRTPGGAHRFSFPQIGKALNRHHSTVILGVRRYTELRDAKASTEHQFKRAA